MEVTLLIYRFVFRKDIYTNEGDSISIDCSPSGVPTPVVSWELPSGNKYSTPEF